MRDLERERGRELALAMLVNEAGLGAASRTHTLSDNSVLFQFDEDLIGEIDASSDQAKRSAITTLHMVATSLVMALSEETGREMTEIVDTLARNLRGFS